MNRRYEVLDVLGSGGMATVWKARDTELNRIVAIKRPHPAPDGSAVHERFRREARAAATVSHPNLVTVHDVGTDADGPYLVMEFVDAGSLAQVEWSRARAIRIGSDIAGALAALHSAGIVHRDVKPANILVPEGGAMLTDFGIARAGDDAALTQEGTTFATPAYAAPEVIAHGDHTPASDVYALGAVLREMILGRRVTPTNDTQVLIADDLWAPLLDRAMSPRPEERPSASVFAADLRALPGSAGLPPTTALGVEPAVAAVDRGETARPGDDPTIAKVVSPTAVRQWAPMFAIVLTAILVLAALVLAVRRTNGEDDDVGVIQPSSTSPVAESEAPLVTADEIPVTTAAPTVAPIEVPETPPVTEPQATAAPDTPPVIEPPETSPPAAPEPDQPSGAEATRNDLVDYVSNLRGGVLKPKEAEKLIEDVDKAIEAASDGDIEQATDGIEDALDRIDKEVADDATADGATELVRRLADQLGIEVDGDRDDDSEDSDDRDDDSDDDE